MKCFCSLFLLMLISVLLLTSIAYGESITVMGDTCYNLVSSREFNINHNKPPKLIIQVILMLIYVIVFLIALNIYFKNKINEKTAEIRIKNDVLNKNNVKLKEDIEKIKRKEKLIYDMAYFDSLTKLPNRSRLYQDLIKLCIAHNKFILIFMDLDNFKYINDTWGHSFGDELLKEIAIKSRNFITDGCEMYRWGGDEFIIICSNENIIFDLENHLKSLVKFFDQLFSVKDKQFFITMSAGISVYPDDSNDPEVLIKNADMAMYQAKANGKNKYQIYNKELSIKALRKVRLKQKLKFALKNNEFRVYYQPCIDVQSGKIISMEALVRWIDCDNNMILPGEFIPIAEESRIIIQIGEFVLRSACRQTKLWHDKGCDFLRVAVNLSARQFEDNHLMSMIDNVLSETGLAPQYLELEITETMVMKDIEASIRLIDQLRKRGIKISLDDFGTGYSSLNYLRQLPIDTIKIDKSFMDMVTENDSKAMVTKGVILLGHLLGLRLIAEGIEKEEQLDFLKLYGCEQYQGFYFSKPVDPKAFEELLNKNLEQKVV